MAQVDGGDFVTIHDFADEYMGVSYGELSMLHFDSMQRKEFDLNDYVAKKSASHSVIQAPTEQQYLSMP